MGSLTKFFPNTTNGKVFFSSLPAHVQAIGPVLMWKICRTSNGCRDTLRPDQRRQNNGISGGSGNQTVQSFIRRATPCVAFVAAHISCTGPGSELSGVSKAVSAQGQGCPSWGATLVQGVYIHVCNSRCRSWLLSTPHKLSESELPADDKGWIERGCTTVWCCTYSCGSGNGPVAEKVASDAVRAEVEGANNLVEVYDTESVNLCKCASTTITELSYRV